MSKCKTLLYLPIEPMDSKIFSSTQVEVVSGENLPTTEKRICEKGFQKRFAD